jgi:Transposase DDE domain
MLASPDQQISLTYPDSRSMATSGPGSGVVGYNVQVAVDTEHHLIVTHEVTNDGSDRAQLANIACQAKEALGVDDLAAVADRGYYSSEKILTCHQAGITRAIVDPQQASGRSGPMSQAGTSLKVVPFGRIARSLKGLSSQLDRLAALLREEVK